MLSSLRMGSVSGAIGAPMVTRNGWPALFSTSLNSVTSRTVGWIASSR